MDLDVSECGVPSDGLIRRSLLYSLSEVLSSMNFFYLPFFLEYKSYLGLIFLLAEAII